MILTQEGKYDAAVEQFRKALAIEPNSVESHINLATTYAAAKYDTQAEESLRAALRLQPGNRTARYNLASLLLDENKPRAALEEVLSILSPDPSSRLGLSRIPDSAALYWTSGLIAIAGGRQQEAETALKKASRLNASSQTYLATLGMLYYQEGRYSEASDVLKQCMKLFPRGVMDFQKINAVLNASRDSSPQTPAVLSAAAWTQLCQPAIAMHDQEQ